MFRFDRVRLVRPSVPFIAAVVAAILLVIPDRPASAQVLYGSIVGNVSDAQGGIAPGVTLTATNTGTGLKVETVTDADGAYAFRNLLPGTYDLTATLSGFREHKQTGHSGDRGQPRARQRRARGRRHHRDHSGRQRHDAPADGQGRRPHRADVEGDRRPAAQPVPELPGAASTWCRARHRRSSRTPRSTRRAGRCARGSTARSRTATPRASTARCR